ncbi:epsin-1-like [Impatiens glandulifera]|uniref:epsin-1-like n=1 Tax=Impatiens glandulifera TaxID=253017 RepID=UPI001FB0B588|nr:epsin-1-like [Impatiens glandulifera]
MASSFHDLKRQASLMFRDKINKARWAITSATPAQILIEEAINNGDTTALEGPSMKVISQAAFDVDDYYRIVDVLHTRLNEFDKSKWRCSYKALVMLEHLLTHGPERIAEEFISDADSIMKMEQGFQFVDEKGINWGSNMKNKCLRIQKLLKDKPFLKDERARTRQVTRSITGIESSHKNTSSPPREEFRRFNSHYTGDNNNQYNKVVEDETEEELHPFSLKENQTGVDSLLSSV